MSKNIDKITVFKIKTKTGWVNIYLENNRLVFEDRYNDTMVFGEKYIEDIIAVLTEIQQNT